MGFLYEFVKKIGLAVPPVKKIYDERNELARQIASLDSLNPLLNEELSKLRDYIDTLAPVVQYRLAFFEDRGVAVENGGRSSLPITHAYPLNDNTLTYELTLLSLLNLSDGKGAEIGPLNHPIMRKEDCNVLYVDHLDTEGLKKKYTNVDGIVDIDRPMINNSLVDTLCDDAPLDYIIASQVFEHVPNPYTMVAVVMSI